MTVKLHPRRARLGLIEAEAQKLIREIVFPGIRGARASASLKPVVAGECDGLRQGIRGARASASLKHLLAKCRCSRKGKHPRRARLGLIEAVSCIPHC